MPHLTGEHAAISPEILALAHRAGHKIDEVGIDHYPREHGTQSGSNFCVICASFCELVQLRRTIQRKEAPV